MKKRNTILGILTLSLFISGCTQVKQVTLKNKFKIDEAKIIKEKGNNTIRGSALINQRGGGSVTCSGRGVNLVPYNDYSKERIISIYGSDTSGYRSVNHKYTITFNDNPKSYTDYIKKTICDSMGYFKFNNIADGKYFITTGIFWQVGNYNEGGLLMKFIDVAGGETKEVVLAP